MAKRINIWTTNTIGEEDSEQPRKDLGIDYGADDLETQDIFDANEATEKNLGSTSVTAYSAKAVADGSANASKIPPGSGLANSGHGGDPSIIFNRAQGETVFPSTLDPAQIILGDDRPASKVSGYGGPGSDRAASIDMVCGRMAATKGGEGPKPGTYVESDYAADAARICISQLTDIDKNFGLAGGISGVVGGRSGVGIKADLVRLIAREGVKVVTHGARDWKGLGPGGEPNSLGGKIAPAPTIEFIAGNDDEPEETFNLYNGTIEKIQKLQGVAKGENVAAALRDLAVIVDEIWSATFNFMMAQMVFNTAAPIACMPLPGAAVFAGVAAGVATTQVIYSLNPLYHTRNNRNIWELNYLTRAGYRFIESRNVFST